MRVLLDTNVLVAALTTKGTCTDLYQHVSRNHVLISSESIIEELARAMRDKMGSSLAESKAAARAVQDQAEFVEPTPVPENACRDKDDLHVLGAALAGSCDCIVTGDRDLLELREFSSIPIVSPRQFWQFDAAQSDEAR